MAILRPVFLLVTDVPIGCDKYIESGCFGGVKKFAVPESVPATRTGLFDNVVRQSAGYASWRGHTVLQVLKDDGHRCARSREHPGPAHFTRNAFNARTLRPVERGHYKAS